MKQLDKMKEKKNDANVESQVKHPNFSCWVIHCGQYWSSQLVAWSNAGVLISSSINVNYLKNLRLITPLAAWISAPTLTRFNQLANWGLRPHLSRQADLTSDIKIGAHALECRVRACVLLQPGQLGLDLNEALTRFFCGNTSNSSFRGYGGI